MEVCTFFGHRECYSLDEQALTETADAMSELWSINSFSSFRLVCTDRMYNNTFTT